MANLLVQKLCFKTIDELEFGVRITNVLANNNIRFLGELVQKSEQELLSFRGLQRKSLNEIKQFLFEEGLALGLTPKNLNVVIRRNKKAIKNAEYLIKHHKRIQKILKPFKNQTGD